MIYFPYTGSVYLAIHVPTGKSYIGKSIRGLDYRKSSHHSWARSAERGYRYGGRGNKFHNALAKHGPEQFTWGILFSSDDDSVLLREEARLIREFRQRGVPLYNISVGGVGPSGWKHTEESRAKIAAAGVGRIPDEEIRKRISEGVKKSWSYPGSEERRKRVSEQSKNRYFSTETRAKIGEASRNRSPESNAKISAAARNRSPELQALMSARQSASIRNRTPERKAEISATLSSAIRAGFAKKRQAREHYLTLLAKAELNPYRKRPTPPA
jgi:group I intron endonuclease